MRIIEPNIAAGLVPVRWVEMSPAAQPCWDYAAGDYVYGVREVENLDGASP